MITDDGRVVLEARNVEFAYERPILRRISIGLEAGTITGIFGPNGSGKTTALRVLDGILPPSAGSVLYRGDCPLAKMSRRQIGRLIAMVPQNGRAYYYQSVFQFVMTGRSPHLSLLGFESREDEEIAMEALGMTHLLELKEKRVSEISGGEKQRLLLARALAQRPEILLLDEFTANLDINYQVELMRLVQTATRDRNLATLVVSHEINLLANFADRLVLLAEGSIIRQGAVAEVATRENLQRLFGIDFSVRRFPDGTCEILPQMTKGTPS